MQGATMFEYMDWVSNRNCHATHRQWCTLCRTGMACCPKRDACREQSRGGVSQFGTCSHHTKSMEKHTNVSALFSYFYACA